MTGRWRLFRHDAGREAGPPPLAYVVLFVACLVLGQWSAATFQAIIVWPANGVMLAALLQLHRRKAVAVLLVCFALNLASNVLRGDTMPLLLINAVLNMAQVLVAALLARRVGGAALDMRRPRRLIAFGLMAIAPTVALSTSLSIAAGLWLRGYSPVYAAFVWRHMFGMELLGLLIVTPSLLLLARAHRFREEGTARPSEAVGLLLLLAATTAWVFSRPEAMAYLVLPPLLLVAFRLSPPWTAAALILTTAISGMATLTGHGPVMLTPVPDVADLAAVPLRMRQMGAYYVFLLVTVITALPVSTLMSERRQLTARLQRRTAAALKARAAAEAADAAKSRFLALMSHEMRTPLNGVVGYADLLSRRTDLPAEAATQVEAVRRSGDAMLMLVEDVLDFSRGGEEVSAENLSLADLLQEAAAPAMANARAKGLPVTLAVEPGAQGTFFGERRRLRQALHHLISNAVKFTDCGEVRVTAGYDSGAVSIIVADTGVGIAPDLMPHLFEAFVQGDDSLQRRHMGAGVGLPLVQALAQRMGGRIETRSVVGEGATFVLTVPMPRLSEEPVAAVGEADRALRVLIVDDHPVNREMMRLMLAAADCETVEAVDGMEAVERAGEGAFDLILMDVRMPRLDGLAATRQIRALASPAAAAPILAVTADAMPEDADRCRDAGMDGHLAKPITHVRLYAAIDQAMQAAAARLERAAA
ncbi:MULTISPECIES: response regulator [unclassified Brevundimonas]|uniref:hybrid sensor histidine kinase/response regulator n=1 Tax=unclassified Brevundimonas TaxID=2622653 RepID=UPI003F92910F